MDAFKLQLGHEKLYQNELKAFKSSNLKAFSSLI